MLSAAHDLRRFVSALKALPKNAKNGTKQTIAYLALEKIGAIYHLDNLLSELPSEERRSRRQLVIKPLVEDFFASLRR